MTRPAHRRFLIPFLGLLAAGFVQAKDASWWNEGWTQRQKLTIDASDVKDPVGDAAVLVRLHDGNFQFANAAENGADIRFVAEDGKTVLPHQVEKYDGLLNEAFVWVKVPAIKPGAQTVISLYYGSTESPKMPAPAANETFDADTALVYHFSLGVANPADSTKNANNASNTAVIGDGAIIGGGLRLAGGDPLSIPNSTTLEWKAGQALTLSAWIKPSVLAPQTVLLSRGDAFRLIVDQGVLVLDVAGTRSPVGAPLAAASWSHVAIVSEGSNLKLFVNGSLYSTLAKPLPASTTPILVGGATADAAKFAGDLDELVISNTSRPPGWLKLSASSQGTGADAAKKVSLGGFEGEGTEPKSAVWEHLSLFGDISKNMMFDGWIAIGICAVMIVIGWTVAIRKFAYLNSIDKGSKEFLRLWKNLSTDLTALDPDDAKSVNSLGGSVDPEKQGLIKKSPLYHIYFIGTEEIRHRLQKDSVRLNGLSGRSIQAIRASLDAGLVHENHRLTDGLVYLTISIAGGPYVGLLGTVVGVMITFAIIAKSGEVNVNSIAPGIASALLATVVGLVVAIPALFIYSYLNARIKNAMGLMQVFIDEFVAKMAEFYRPPNEPDKVEKAH
jgi:biopolymer transport protein ExbB